MTTSISFPGEKYLLESVPNYVLERQFLIIKLILVFSFWGLILPLLSAKEELEEEETQTEVRDKILSNTKKEPNNEPPRQEKRNVHNGPSKMESRRRSKKKAATSHTNVIQTKGGNVKHAKVLTTSSKTSATIKVIDWRINMICSICCVIHMFYVLLMSSPDNYYTSRTVFETPLFTSRECDYLVEMAERVASTNYQIAQNYTKDNAFMIASNNKINRKTTSNHLTTDTAKDLNTTMNEFLQPPLGWQKTRHTNYPTTDLNLVTDPFTKEDRIWIQEKLDARLAPTLERIYGIPSSSIRASDIFFIRYDGDRQASLSRHTDDGSITFSVLLSSGFEGGGTWYWNRVGGSGKQKHKQRKRGGEVFVNVLPEKGMMTTFPAVLEHEGIQTTKGQRYLMIGFLAVDKIDPWTKQSTGLSWFASWLSLNWSSVKFKEGHRSAFLRIMDGLPITKWTSTKTAGLFFEKLYRFIVALGDIIYEHRFVQLINTTVADDFLHVMDESYAVDSKTSHSRRQHGKASWFSGQQIRVDIDGTFLENWMTREGNDEKFETL